jgi:GNAT superfamily N-acetyltransferase
MSVILTRTNSENPDFISLVRLLDADLADRDGAEHAFYAQFNKIDKIKHVVVAYLDGQAAGCGAIKEYTPGKMEVKRMFTRLDFRGRGIAGKVLAELEAWAAELSCEACILETGVKQAEAIRLYEKHGYHRIENYGQYAGIGNSVCFEKQIEPAR